MRKILLITLLSLLPVLYSCEKNSIISDNITEEEQELNEKEILNEEEIKSSRTVEMNDIIFIVSFDNNGGVVSVKNIDNLYRGWWINYIKNEDTGVYYNAAKTSANGDGILAKIVSEDTVAIKVKPSKEKHTWTVTMEFEDYFCYILVKQN